MRPSALAFDDIKEALPLPRLIEALGLRRRGRSFQCPNAGAHRHGDRTPSAWIASTGRSWTCYTCGSGGTALDLVMAAEGCSLQEAADLLARWAGLETAPPRDPKGPGPRAQNQKPSPLPKEPPPEPDPSPAAPEVEAFLRKAQATLRQQRAACQYLEMRGIPLSIAVQAGLGYAPAGTWPHARGAQQPRIVAPLTTPEGMLLTLYGRSIIPCEKGLRHDFLPGARGLFHASALAQEGVILVEGVFDALACLAGGKPATALGGLTLREGWWARIPAQTLILALDADEAGRTRWQAMAEAGARAGKTVYVLRAETCLEGSKDLNEYWVRHRRLPRVLEAGV